MGVKFSKVTLMGAKFVKKVPLQVYFLTKSEFSVLIFVEKVKYSPLWVQKSAKPYPYGCFECLKNPIFMGAICFKTRPFWVHIRRDSKY